MISLSSGDKFIDFCHYLNEVIATRFVIPREMYTLMGVCLNSIEEDLKGRYDLFLMRINKNPKSCKARELIKNHDLEYLKVNESGVIEVNVEFIKDVEAYGFDIAYEMSISSD